MRFVGYRIAMTDDQAFKDVFGYPKMVRGLLRWFAGGLHGLSGLVDSLDLTRLERAHEQSILPGTEGTRLGQASDIVWRAPFAGIPEADREPWQQLVMPWECQSEPNYLMPVRMRAYVDGQHLEGLKRRRLPSTGRLAPVLPIVVYTGEQVWPVPARVADLLPSLPGMPRPASPEAAMAGRGLLAGEGYLTLDIGALRQDDFDDSNAASLLARLTSPRPGHASARHARMLLEQLRDEPVGLRKAAFAWIRQVSGLDLGDNDMEALERMQPAQQERHFAGRLRLWHNRLRAEGVAKGLAEGLAHERELLVRQATRKFGAGVAGGLADVLNGVDDTARLAELGDWIIDCKTGDEFAGRISRTGNGRD